MTFSLSAAPIARFDCGKLLLQEIRGDSSTDTPQETKQILNLHLSFTKISTTHHAGSEPLSIAKKIQLCNRVHVTVLQSK